MRLAASGPGRRARKGLSSGTSTNSRNSTALLRGVCSPVHSTLSTRGAAVASPHEKVSNCPTRLPRGLSAPLAGQSPRFSIKTPNHDATASRNLRPGCRERRPSGVIPNRSRASRAVQCRSVRAAPSLRPSPWRCSWRRLQNVHLPHSELFREWRYLVLDIDHDRVGFQAWSAPLTRRKPREDLEPAKR